MTRYVACRSTVVREFGTDYDAAQRAYEEAERAASGRREVDVVLLSADSLETVKRTHSSYFELRTLDDVGSRRSTARLLAGQW